MKKIISFVGLFAVLGVGIGDAHGVAMSAQVRRLLQEKQEKIEQLEKCEGKKQGWMIAGISTIGLTAVGVGVNIAQASKSNRLSDEIEMEKSTLERHQNELNRIQNDIAAERARQSEANKCCDMKRRCCECEKLNNGDCPGDGDDGVTAYDYSKYKLDCDTVKFYFLKTGYADAVTRLNTECVRVTGENMVRTEDGDYIYFECENYKEKANCGKQQNDKDCPDITYSYAWPLAEPYASKIREKLAKYEESCRTQGGSFDYVQATTPAGDVAIDGGKAVCKNRTRCDANEEVVVHIDVDTGVEPVTPVTPVKPDQKKSEKQTECKEGYVRIGGEGECVKRDYLFTDQCKCAKDPSKMCKLDTDHGGDFVCQLAKGIGKKCKCEDCPKGESWNGSKCVNPTDEAKDTKSAAYCVKHVRDYLVRECPKCISNKNGLDGSGFWDYMGESICADIANNGGLYSIKWDGNTDTATLFLLWANQNQFSTKIECPRECGKL